MPTTTSSNAFTASHMCAELSALSAKSFSMKVGGAVLTETEHSRVAPVTTARDVPVAVKTVWRTPCMDWDDQGLYA